MAGEFLDERPPVTFWLVGAAALVWNLLGVMMYVGTVTATPESLAAQGYTPQQAEFMLSTPAWATSVFATAVTAGALASLLLLLRKAWAIPLFAVSLVAVVVMDVYTFVLQDAVAVLGMTTAYVQSTVLVIAILLLGYSRYARNRRWL